MPCKSYQRSTVSQPYLDLLHAKLLAEVVKASEDIIKDVDNPRSASTDHAVELADIREEYRQISGIISSEGIY